MSPVVDVLVAGGGPAGLATAIHAARAGLSVLVVEPRAAPIDKACGEGLMPGAVTALRAIGVEPQGHPFHGIRYVDGPHVAEARFRGGHGLGVRRTHLHAAMAAAADEHGVRTVHGRVGSITQGDGWVEAETSTGVVRSRYLVAADGLHSPIRAALGLQEGSGSAPARYGVRRHLALAPWSSFVEVHWGRDYEIYVTPVAEDTIGVALLGPRGARLDEAMAALPELRDRLAGASAVSADRGAGPLRQEVGARVAGRVVLVGDAAGYVDAITGEGLRLAADEAHAAVDCMVRDRLPEYEKTWDDITSGYRRGTGLLLAAARRPALRRKIVPTAERLPRLFARCVDAVAGGTARSDDSLTPVTGTP